MLGILALFTFLLSVEMLEELFLRSHIINPFVGFDGIIEVDESQQADLTLFTISEFLLGMPHLH